MRRRTTWTASPIPVAALLVLFCSPPADAEGLYLHMLHIEAAELPDVTLPVWKIALTVSDPEKQLRALPAGLAPEMVDGRVVISVAPDQVIGGEPGDAHRSASFVIDFDEPAVDTLVRNLLEAHPAPTIDEIVRFTHEAIPDKHLGRGWDLASRVAERGEGDCTEHAVLLTALARAAGYPARVIVGIVLLVGDGELLAVGHAWTEIHDGSRWIAADATGISDEGDSRLIPLSTMEDEGPGYQMDLFGRILLTRPERLELLPSANPASPSSS